MTWAYILRLIGPGLHWSKSHEELTKAMNKAKKAGRHEAADHIEMIRDRRDAVMFDVSPRSLESPQERKTP